MSGGTKRAKASRGSMGPMPRPSEEAKARFEALVPDHPGVGVRPMFGNVAAFLNGNMFMGLFGDDLFVRLPEDGRAALLKKGGAEFEPMPGHPMRDYVTLPSAWLKRPRTAESWVARSLAWASGLPPKEAKKKRS